MWNHILRVGTLIWLIQVLGGCTGSGVNARSSAVSIESRTLAPVASGTPGITLLLNQRIVAGGRIVLEGRNIEPDGSVFFHHRECTMDGAPIVWWQEGFWGDRWNHFETRYSGTGATQFINESTNTTDLPDRTFSDPTILWFWHTHPRVGESVVVTNLSQNTILTSQIRYTYEGDEELTLAGRTVTVHRVREDPVGTDGVFTIWWYDQQGMGVKRFHKTTKHEYTEQLAAWR